VGVDGLLYHKVTPCMPLPPQVQRGNKPVGPPDKNR
jgi:hypothetical protein